MKKKIFSILAKTKKSGITDHQNNEGQKEDLELPFFELSTIVCATNNFSFKNKLGEGGFGSVYKVSLWCACTKEIKMMKYSFSLFSFQNLAICKWEFQGTLEDNQEIAVKRLSRSSGQGLNEFKNEVRLIAKLQHRNLVKLLGCCIQQEEKILIYEYMPNKSLDCFIFGLNP